MIVFPHPPDLPLCPRELAECRKTQQEENTDESRSRVQLASIEAKHVSGGLGASPSTSSSSCSAAARGAAGLQLCR